MQSVPPLRVGYAGTVVIEWKETRRYWHTARVTNMCVGHSVFVGVRPSSKKRADLHFCSDYVSRTLPV